MSQKEKEKLHHSYLKYIEKHINGSNSKIKTNRNSAELRLLKAKKGFWEGCNLRREIVHRFWWKDVEFFYYRNDVAMYLGEIKAFS